MCVGVNSTGTDRECFSLIFPINQGLMFHANYLKVNFLGKIMIFSNCHLTFLQVSLELTSSSHMQNGFMWFGLLQNVYDVFLFYLNKNTVHNVQSDQ